MFRPFLTGFASFIACFIVFAWQFGFNFQLVLCFCVVLLLLGSLFALAFLGQQAFSEHKPWLLHFWSRVLPSLRWSKRSKEATKLSNQIYYVCEKMRGFSLACAEERRAYYESNGLVPTYAPPEPHQAFLVEFETLVRSLSHLGSRSKPAQLQHLRFYHRLFQELEQSFDLWQQQYIQQERLATEALSQVKAFHKSMYCKEICQDQRYWDYYGSLEILEDLFCGGSLPVEALLSQLQTIQQRLEVLLTRANNGVL